jgi:hypothetical protein
MTGNDDETIEKQAYPISFIDSDCLLRMLTIPMHDFDLSLLIEINRLLLPCRLVITA